MKKRGQVTAGNPFKNFLATQPATTNTNQPISPSQETQSNYLPKEKFNPTTLIVIGALVIITLVAIIIVGFSVLSGGDDPTPGTSGTPGSSGTPGAPGVSGTHGTPGTAGAPGVNGTTVRDSLDNLPPEEAEIKLTQLGMFADFFESVWPSPQLSPSGGTDIYYNDGYVGIGTNVPRAELTIGDINPILFMSDHPTISFNAYYEGNEFKVATGGMYTGLISMDPNNGLMRFYTGGNAASGESAGTTPKFVIDNGGNVGIGTTTPGYWSVQSGLGKDPPSSVLTIEGVNRSALELVGSRSEEEENHGLGSVAWVNTESTLEDKRVVSITGRRGDTNRAGILRIYTRNPTGDDWSLGINQDSNGNIGIKTDTPGDILHVYGGDSNYNNPAYTIGTNTDVIIEDDSHTGIQFLSPSDKSSMLYFGDQDSAIAGVIQYNHLTDGMYFYTDSAPKLVIGKAGDVTIDNLKASDTRDYVCVDSNGKLEASNVACE